MMTWILAICSGQKIGAYLSDITGAFDRVFKIYMLAKLHFFFVYATLQRCDHSRINGKMTTSIQTYARTDAAKKTN